MSEKGDRTPNIVRQFYNGRVRQFYNGRIIRLGLVGNLKLCENIRTKGDDEKRMNYKKVSLIENYIKVKK